MRTATLHITAVAFTLLIGVALAAGDPAGKYAKVSSSQPASAPADANGKTDPAGLPLEAKIILKKDTYQIPPGQSGEAFAKKLKEFEKTHAMPPAPPAVEMTFELTNTGKKAVTIPLGGDSTSLNLKLDGPGAVTIPYMMMHTMEFRGGSPFTIEPGKSMAIQIARLQHGMRGDSYASYWTAPGTYILTASYITTIQGLDLKEDQQATITSPPVKIKVTEPENK